MPFIQEKFPAEKIPVVFVAGWQFAEAVESLRPILFSAWQQALIREKRIQLHLLQLQLQAQKSASASGEVMA